MATLYRPTVTRYVLGGKAVPKSTPGATKNQVKSKIWWGRFTNASGKREQVRLSANKQEAKKMLAELERNADLERAGLIAPRRGGQVPLEELLSLYRQFLSAKGSTGAHVDRTLGCLEKVITAAKIKRAIELSPSECLAFLGQLGQGESLPEMPAGDWFTKTDAVRLCQIHPDTLPRMVKKHGGAKGQGKDRRYSRELIETIREGKGQGLGKTAINHYITALRGFSRWLYEEEFTPKDLLLKLKKQNTSDDRRIERRTLSAKEIETLLAATSQGKSFRGISGEDRASLYRLALGTGFRASELASLTPSSFDFDGKTVTVQAAYSKRRREDVQPVSSATLEAVRKIVERTEPLARLWPGSWPSRAFEMIEIDLTAANIPQKVEGKVFDFHALRHQYITDLIAKGLSPVDVQELARHSSITLTVDRYTHLDRGRLGKLLEDLDK